MSNENNQNNQNLSDEEKKRYSRRSFLKNSALTAGGAAIGGGLIGALGGQQKEKIVEKEVQVAPEKESHHAMMFFTDMNDLRTIEAAAERIYPETSEGSGAKGLGVAYYIDHQLAGAWGNNTKEYHVGPFFEKEAIPQQGYQTRLRRNEVFMGGIALLNEEANKRFEKSFTDIEGEEQDEILKDIEADKIHPRGTATGSYFFSLLRQATIEGVYSDPLYGGNKNMEAWKMRKYPGTNTHSFMKTVDAEKFVNIEPKSLKDHM